MRSEKPFERSKLSVWQQWLTELRFEADVLANNRYCGDWRIALSGHCAMPFHIIGQGGCRLVTRQGESLLKEGDWVFFPRDTWHELLPVAGVEPAIVLCGCLHVTTPAALPLFDWLPDVWCIQQVDRYSSLTMLTQVFIHEASQSHDKMVLNRLCETLFALLLRDYVQLLDQQHGVMSAITDVRLLNVLQAIHQQPALAWTVESLARVAAMSRTGFALAFVQAVGLTPMEYLTRWRMNRAVVLLQQKQQSVSRIAEEVGYLSEDAFRKAFKRVTGQPLAAFR